MMQGSLGDCWLLSAISSFASDKNDLYKLFNEKERNAAGIYSINLYSSLGVPVKIVIDDKVPFRIDD